MSATGTEQSLSSSIQSVEVLGSIELAKKSPVSLGEALDGELGIAKRSFGPGTARPVIRGFDGDRVLVLQDGNRVGGLGFESGDHAEPVDVLTVERVEVVKGPQHCSTGSDAIGGVVNAVSGHDPPHKGINGDLTGLGSTNRGQGGGSGGVKRHGKMVNLGNRRSELRRLPHAHRRVQIRSRGNSAPRRDSVTTQKGVLQFQLQLQQAALWIPSIRMKSTLKSSN